MIPTRTVAGPTTRLLISLVFAVILLAIQSAEFWMDSWQPGEGQTAPITLRLPTYSVVRLHLGQPAELIRRQVIIGRGEIGRGVDSRVDVDARLAAAYEQSRRESQVPWSVGIFLVGFVACFLFLAELKRAAGPSRLLRGQGTLLLFILVLALGAKAFLLLTSLPAYYFPMPAIVLLTCFLMGRRVALATNLFSSTVFASFLGFDVSVLVVLFTTSYAGTLFLKSRKRRRAIFFAGCLSGWFGALAQLVLMLIFNGTINVSDELFHPDYSALFAAVACGVFSGTLAFLIVDPVGWMVGRVSPTKLLELQDLDHPILKQIRDEAPGTWEHSRAAANLAEAAAAAIGADSLLVRIGAYVHDAGKALNPAYFIENQSTLGVKNPHNELEPEVSADCIFDHVREGTEILRKHHVPETVVEFAYTHHGTSLLEYFWFKVMQAGNPKELKEKAFHYPGMKPKSRETGILMIVDAVEAASRTIKEPAKHKFETLVQRIVFTKLNQGQLDDSGLTLADLKTVTSTLVDSLVNMYHARIEYPWQLTRSDEMKTGAHRISTVTGQTGQHAVITQTGQHPSITDTGQTPSVTETGQRPSITQTGQRPSITDADGTPSITQTGQHASITQSGQHQQVSQTGQHQQVSQTGQHQQVSQTGQHQQVSQTGQHQQVSQPEQQQRITPTEGHPADAPNGHQVATQNGQQPENDQNYEPTIEEAPSQMLDALDLGEEQNIQQDAPLRQPHDTEPFPPPEPELASAPVSETPPISPPYPKPTPLPTITHPNTDSGLNRPGTNPGLGTLRQPGQSVKNNDPQSVDETEIQGANSDDADSKVSSFPKSPDYESPIPRAIGDSND